MPIPESHTRSARIPKSVSSETKNIIIKVQVPYDVATSDHIDGGGPLFVYTKKRDFVCMILRQDDPVAYDRVTRVVKAKGPGGAKAYFAAELRSKHELVVKVSEVLAEQPF